MKTIFLTLLAILVFVNAKADTQEYCANKWPDDYQMRDFCENQQIESKDKLFDIATEKGLVSNGTLSTSATGGDYEKIINRCMKKWKQRHFNTYDYQMVVFCTEQQFEAYTKTTNSGNTTTGSTGIKGYCANKWPDDYQMRDFCENQQIEANHQLFDIAEQHGLVSNGNLSVSKNGNHIEKTINYCLNKWEKNHFKSYDYTMVVYCINQRLN